MADFTTSSLVSWRHWNSLLLVTCSHQTSTLPPSLVASRDTRPYTCCWFHLVPSVGGVWGIHFQQREQEGGTETPDCRLPPALSLTLGPPQPAAQAGDAGSREGNPREVGFRLPPEQHLASFANSLVRKDFLSVYHPFGTGTRQCLICYFVPSGE